MVYILREHLARERQRSLIEAAEVQRVSARARKHRRTVRRAQRAERRLVAQWDQALELQARVRELELVQ